MSEPKYRDWILETIDSLRSRKARPDLDRICRMVRRRHGSDPDRTRAELEKLIQEQTVLKVSYKGSISYRNAAKVQRKSRKKSDQPTDSSSSGSGESVGEQTKHASLNNNGDSAHSLTDQEECEDKDSEPTGASQCPDHQSLTSPVPTSEKSEKVLPLISGNSCVSCGATDCTVGSGCSLKASAAKDKRLIPQAGGNGSSPQRDNETNKDAAVDASNQAKKAQAVETVSPGHEGSDEKEKKTCPSASSGSNSHLVRNKQTPVKPKVKLGSKGMSPSEAQDQISADLGDRLVASVRSLTERNRGSSATRGHTALGLKEILGYLSTQGGMPEEKLTRNRVKVVLEREVAKGRLRRTRLGHITLPTRGMGLAKPSARLLKSALQDTHLAKKEEVKEEEPMEAESVGEDEEEEEEEEKMEELGDVTGENHGTRSPLPVGQFGPKNQNETPVTLTQPHTESAPGGGTGVPKPQQRSSSSSSSSSPSSTLPSTQMETITCSNQGTGPQVRAVCPSVQTVLVVGSEVVRVGENAVTPDQLLSNPQDEVVIVPDGGDLSSSIAIKSCSGCKMEVNASSCLLTPTASPRDSGTADERGINGGVFVKSERSSLNPVEWTVADVASYFAAAGFPEQAMAFRSQEIDGKSLLLMQRNDVLTGLSIRLGPALKIYERHVKVLQRTHFQDDDGFC
ncbi:atherin [Chanos chanos]|uniref:Atherin n=1 Tax=Chanos chanos TaxID=29144 RepID=A0A6J2VWL1_CHACN|nr:atherin-like [Chanos chanos]